MTTNFMRSVTAWTVVAALATPSSLFLRAQQNTQGNAPTAAATPAATLQKLGQERASLEAEIAKALKQMRVNDANGKGSADEHRRYEDLLARYRQVIAAELVAKGAGLTPAQQVPIAVKLISGLKRIFPD